MTFSVFGIVLDDVCARETFRFLPLVNFQHAPPLEGYVDKIPNFKAHGIQWLGMRMTETIETLGLHYLRKNTPISVWRKNRCYNFQKLSKAKISCQIRPLG
jgi:hypothetical protein